jgi:hypothetical protein
MYVIIVIVVFNAVFKCQSLSCARMAHAPFPRLLSDDNVQFSIVYTLEGNLANRLLGSTRQFSDSVSGRLPLVDTTHIINQIMYERTYY